MRKVKRVKEVSIDASNSSRGCRGSLGHQLDPLPLTRQPFTMHTPTASITGLPPRLQVPPFPPRIYPQLTLTVTDEGLLLRPGSDDGVLVGESKAKWIVGQATRRKTI
jgi:hypothetical protein